MTEELEPFIVNLEPLFAGLVIGDLTKQFHPTIEGADLLARMSTGSRNYVIISERAEKLVLYGRDIMGDSVIIASEDLHENELVIITNCAGEAIGIGRTRFSGRLLGQKGKITITTIKDAGRYLREEDKEGQTKIAKSPQRRHS